MRRRGGAAALLVALAALLPAGCGSSSDVGGGKVLANQIRAGVSADGAPLPGVTVALAGPESHTATTGPNGLAVFDGLPAGAFTVTISGFDASRFTFVRTTIPVALDAGIGQVSVEFVGDVVPTGEVSGSVTLGGLPPAQYPGESVVAALVPPRGEPARTVLTDGSGEFSFTGLRAGAYTLRISFRGAEHVMRFALGRDEKRALSVEIPTAER